jgi:galactitol-specific phosphotransferase system IIC component
VVLEHEGPARSLARSWRLVQRSFWRVFGISLLAGLIVVVTAAVLQIPFTLIAGATGGGNAYLPGTTGSFAGVVISAIGSIVAGAVARPISAGVAVLLYVDLRMRREGLDLALQTAAASGGVPSGEEFSSLWRPGAHGPMGQAAPPPPPPPPPPQW